MEGSQFNKQVDKEKVKQDDDKMTDFNDSLVVKKCLIYPKNKYKQWFDLLVVIILLYTAVWVPI